MKLHLPSGLRKALLACIAALAAHSVPFTVATGSALVSSGALVSFAVSQQAVGSDSTWEEPDINDEEDGTGWATTPNGNDVTNGANIASLGENGQYYYKTRGGDNFQFGGGLNSSLKLHRMSEYKGAITTLKKKNGLGLQVSYLWLTGDADPSTDMSVQSFKVTEAGYLTEYIREIYINNVGLWVEANQDNLQANFTIGSSYGTGIKFGTWLNGTLYFNNAHISTSGKLIVAQDSAIAFNQASSYFRVSELEGAGDLRLRAQNTGSYIELLNGGSNYVGALDFSPNGTNFVTIKLGNNTTLNVDALTGSYGKIDHSEGASSSTLTISGTSGSVSHFVFGSGVNLSIKDNASQSFADSTFNNVSLGASSVITLSGSNVMRGNFSTGNGSQVVLAQNGRLQIESGTLTIGTSGLLNMGANSAIVLGSTAAHLDFSGLTDTVANLKILLGFNPYTLEGINSYTIFESGVPTWFSGNWQNFIDLSPLSGEEFQFADGILSWGSIARENSEVTWQGGNLTWIHGSIGWSVSGESNDTHFINGDTAIFGDSSANSGTITLGGNISVTGMTVVGNYTFVLGSNTLTVGEGALTIRNGATLTIDGDDKYAAISAEEDINIERGGTLTLTLAAAGNGANDFLSHISVIGEGSESATLEIKRNGGSANTSNPSITLLNDNLRVRLSTTGATWAEYANVNLMAEVGLVTNETCLNGAENKIGRFTVAGSENGKLVLEDGAHLTIGGEKTSGVYWGDSQLNNYIDLRNSTVLTLGSNLTVKGVKQNDDAAKTGQSIVAQEGIDADLTINSNGNYNFNGSVNLNGGTFTKSGTGNNSQSILGGLTAGTVNINNGSLILSGTLNIAGTLSAAAGTGVVLRNENVALYQGDTNSYAGELNSVKVSMEGAWLSVVNGSTLTLGSDLDVSGVVCYGFENSTLGTIQAAEGQQVRLTIHGGGGTGTNMHSNSLTLGAGVTLVMEEKTGTDNLQKIQGATIEGNVEVKSGTLNFTWSNSSIAGTLSGTGGTLKVDSGANLTLTGGGTYSGTLHINGAADVTGQNPHTGSSSLLLGADLEVGNLTAGTETRNAVGVTSSVDVAGGSTVDLTVNMSGNQSFGANKLTLNEGVILVKKGAGTWTVTDGLTITSGLRVEGGTYALSSQNLTASYGVTLDGGTLGFVYEQTAAQQASKYSFGTLTVGAGNGTLNLGTLAAGTYREVGFAKLTGSGNLNAGTLSGSSSTSYQKLTFSEVKDFHGTVSGTYSGTDQKYSQVVIGHVNQAAAKQAQFNIGVYSSDFRFEGAGSLTLTTLTVEGGDSGKLYMNYDGTFNCSSIILGDEISLVYTYAGESSQSKVISLALADVLDKELKLDINGVAEEYREDGINLGIALGDYSQSLDDLKSQFTLSGLEGEWHLEDKDGTLYLFAGELEKIASVWDEEWGSGGLTGAPESMVAQSKEFGSTTAANAHIWVLSTDANQRGEVYLHGGGCENGSAIVLGGALYDDGADVASLRNKVSWIRMDSGNYHILAGGSSCLHYTADTEAEEAAGGFFANSHIQVEGGTVDYIVGGNHVNNSSFTFHGNSYISVMEGATVKGGIVGGSTLTKGSNHEEVYAFDGDTNIFIYTALSNPTGDYTFKGMWDGTSSAGTGDNGLNDDGTHAMYGAAFTAVVGGNAWIDRAASGEGVGMNPTFHGNSNITIDLTEIVSGTFAKDIVGGNYTATVLSSDTEDEDNMHNTTFEGDTHIQIIVSDTYDVLTGITFSGAINGASRRASSGTGTTYFTGNTNIEISGTQGTYIAPIAGGFFFAATADGNHGAYLDGNTNVTLTGGTFWRVVGGSYSLAGDSGTGEVINGNSNVTIRRADGSTNSVYFNSFYYGGSNTEDQKQIPFIAGGSFYRNNAGSNRHIGSSSVVIEDGQFGLFDSIHIVGGDYANFYGSSSAESSITQNTSVAISGVGTAIQGIVVGGSYLTDEGAGGTISIGTFDDSGSGVSGTSSVTVTGGGLNADADYDSHEHDHNGIAIVGGSMLADLNTSAAGDHTIKTVNTAVTVDGGTIQGHIVGGHYATDSTGTNTLTITGTTTINLTGGTIGSETKRSNIIGGHYSANTTSPDELNLGDVTITVGGSTINGDIIGGSWREATVALESTAGDKQNKGTVTIKLNSGTLNGDVWAAGYHVHEAAFTAHTEGTEVSIGSGFVFTGSHTVSGSYYKGTPEPSTEEEEEAALSTVENTSDLSTVGSAKLSFADAAYGNIGSITFKDFSEIAVTNANANVTLANEFSTEFATLTKSGSGTLTVQGLSRTGSTDKLGLTVSQGKVVLSQGVTLGAVSVAGELELGTNTLTASSLSGTGEISLSSGGHISGLTSLSSTGKLSISISDLTKDGLLAADYELFQGEDFDSSWWDLIDLDIDGLSGWTGVGLILNDNGSIRLATYTDEIVWNGGSAEWAAGDTDIEWTNSGVGVSFAQPHLTGNKVNVRFNNAASATTITLSGAITVDKMTVGSNYTFNGSGSHSLTINDNLDITAGTFQLGTNGQASTSANVIVKGTLSMAANTELSLYNGQGGNQITLEQGGTITKLKTHGGTIITGKNLTIDSWTMDSSARVTFSNMNATSPITLTINAADSKNRRCFTFGEGVNVVFNGAFGHGEAHKDDNTQAIFNGTATFKSAATFSNVATFAKSATFNGAVTVNQGYDADGKRGNVTINGTATFDSTLTMNGGTMTLAGGDSFGGDVTVSNGSSLISNGKVDLSGHTLLLDGKTSNTATASVSGAFSAGVLQLQAGEITLTQGGSVDSLVFDRYTQNNVKNGAKLNLGKDLTLSGVTKNGGDWTDLHFTNANTEAGSDMVYVVTGAAAVLSNLTGADIGANVGLATNKAMELGDGFSFSGTLKTGADLTLAGGATVGTLQLNNTLTMDKGTAGSHKLTLTTLELGSGATLNVGANGLSKNGALISAGSLSGRLELNLTKEWNLAGALENEGDEYVTYNLFDGAADWAGLTLAGLDGWSIEGKYDRWDVAYEGGNLVFHHTKYSTPNLIYWATDADGVWKASNDDTNDWAGDDGQAGEYQYEADRSVIFGASAQKAVKVYGEVQAHNMTVQEAGYSYTAAEEGGTLSISGNLEVGAAAEFAVGTTVVGKLSGAGQLTVSGSAAERLTAQGGAEYSGDIIVNGVFDVGVTVSSSGEVAAQATAIKSSLGEVRLNSGATMNMGLGAIGSVELSEAALHIYDEVSVGSLRASAGEIGLSDSKTLSVTDGVSQTDASGALAVSGTGALAVSGAMQLSGELAVSGASITVQGDFSAAKATLNSGSQLSVASGAISTLSGNGGSLTVGKAMAISNATGTLTSLAVNGTLTMGSNNGANQLTLKGLALGAGATLAIDGAGLSAEKALLNLSSGFSLSGEGMLTLDLTGWSGLKGSLTDRKSGHSFALFGGDGLAGLDLEADITWDKVADDSGEWEVALEGGNLVFSYKAEALNDEEHLYWSDDSDGTWSADTQWGRTDNGEALYEYDADKTVIFGDAPDKKEVALDGDIEVANMDVQGDYNFVIDEEKGSLTVHGGLHIAYMRSATFLGSGTVAVNSVTGEGTLVVDVVEGDGVTLTLGEGAKESFQGNVTLNQGTLTLEKGLALAGSDDAAKDDTGILNLVTGVLNVQEGDVTAKRIIVGSGIAKAYSAIAAMAADASGAGEVVLITGADSTLSAESIVGMGTLKNADGLSNTLAGDAAGFAGTISAGVGSTWTLKGRLTGNALSMKLAGEGAIAIEYSGSDTLELEGAITESVSLKNAMGAGTTLALTHAGNSSTGSLALESNTIQLGTADKAGSWAGSALEGAGEFVLVNGVLKAAVAPAAGVSLTVDALGEVNAGGTAGSDISSIVVHGDAGALLTNVAGGIVAGGKGGMSVALVLGKQNVANTKESAYLITESGDLTVNEIGKNGLTLDFSAGAFVETLKAHRSEYKTRVHLLSGGELTNKGGDLNDLLSGAYGTLLGDIGFNFVGAEGGDLVLSGTSKDVYLALNSWTEDGVTDDPDAKSRAHSVKGNDVLSQFKATVVDAGVELDVEADSGELLVNNLVGLEGASFHAHAAEGAGEVTIVLNNAAVADFDENGIDHVDDAVDVKGQDTSFAGSIVGERGVHFAKTGAGTLTVGSENGSGGMKLAGNLTLSNGGITLQGDDDSTVKDLIFAYEDGAEEGGLCVTNDATLTVKGSMTESNDKGGLVSLEKQGSLALNGESELSHTSISGDGTGSLIINEKGSLTMPADGALSNVSATVNGALDLGAGKGNSLSGLSGSGTLAGATGCELTLTGASSFSGTLDGSKAGSASGSMSGGGTLTVAEGASLTLDNAKSTDYVWNVNVQGGGSLTVDVQKSPTELGNITLNEGSSFTYVFTTDNDKRLKGNLDVLGSSDFTITIEGDTAPIDNIELGLALTQGELSSLNVSFAGEVGMYLEAELMKDENGYLSVGSSLTKEVKWTTGGAKNAQAGASMFWSTGMPGSEGRKYMDANPLGDLSIFWHGLYTAQSNGENTDRAFAAGAGAAVSVLGSAVTQDMERQLNTIRNRSSMLCDSSSSATYHAWLSAESSYHKLDADGLAPGFTLNGWGGTVGMDTQVHGNVSLGLSITAMYNDLKTESADNGSGDLDTTYLSGFARVSKGAWSHTVVLSAGVVDTNLNRTVSSPLGYAYRTHGETDGYALGAMYEVGYTRIMNESGTLAVQPIANVKVKYANLKGYSESGSDAGLRVDDISHSVVTLGAGARLQMVIGDRVFNRDSILEARALLKVDLGDRESSAATSLLYGSGSAGVESAGVGRAGIELGAGLSIPINSLSGSVFVDGSLELRAGYTNMNASAGYRVNF